jgi:hypothetical protein
MANTETNANVKEALELNLERYQALVKELEDTLEHTASVNNVNAALEDDRSNKAARIVDLSNEVASLRSKLADLTNNDRLKQMEAESSRALLRNNIKALDEMKTLQTTNLKKSLRQRDDRAARVSQHNIDNLNAVEDRAIQQYTQPDASRRQDNAPPPLHQRLPRPELVQHDSVEVRRHSKSSGKHGDRPVGVKPKGAAALHPHTAPPRPARRHKQPLAPPPRSKSTHASFSSIHHHHRRGKPQHYLQTPKKAHPTLKRV